MKKIQYFLLAFALVILSSCTVDDIQDPIEISHTGGILNIDKSLIGYVVGNNGTYDVSGSIYQGASVTTTKVDFYKKFSSTDGSESDTVLFHTETFTGASSRDTFNVTLNYADLIDGLTLNGSPLPSADSGLNIGDFWTISYIATTSQGNENKSDKTTKISIGTRYAGVYKVVTGDYWRINVPRPDVSWVDEEVVIESVDAITYKHKGLAVWDNNTYWFTVTGTQVTVLPTDPNGNAILLNDQPITTCETDPSNLTHVNCGTSNFVEPDDINGKDRIYITVGYLAGSGPREFYEILEKI